MRRFRNFQDGEQGFTDAPDLLLIDGGEVHAQTAERVLTELELQFPVYGMVKDNRHRTRALISASGEEIGISNNPAVFALIGQIQEETHRFAIEYNRLLRSKRLRESVLDEIPGIGPVRKQKLLKHFKSISAIKRASEADLEPLVGKNQAQIVFEYFRENEGKNEI